jgi:hypothetical protein
MNWKTLQPTIETIIDKHQKRKAYSIGEMDQDIAAFQDMFKKLEFDVNSLSDRDVYIIVVTVITSWWVAIQAEKTGDFTEEETQACLKNDLTTVWGLLASSNSKFLER